MVFIQVRPPWNLYFCPSIKVSSFSRNTSVSWTDKLFSICFPIPWQHQSVIPTTSLWRTLDYHPSSQNWAGKNRGIWEMDTKHTIFFQHFDYPVTAERARIHLQDWTIIYCSGSECCSEAEKQITVHLVQHPIATQVLFMSHSVMELLFFHLYRLISLWKHIRIIS